MSRAGEIGGLGGLNILYPGSWHDAPPPLVVQFFENIFIILINWALLETYLVKSDDFFVFRGVHLKPPDTWSPTSEVISLVLNMPILFPTSFSMPIITNAHKPRSPRNPKQHSPSSYVI